MQSRCTPNGERQEYADYYGRGIRVFPSWLGPGGFEQFLAYLDSSIGRRPTTAHELDRIDNDGNYEPGNIRWASRHDNMLNRRTVKGLEARVAELQRQLRSDSWRQEGRDAIQEAENSPA
jgi:hypothetical protein